MRYLSRAYENLIFVVELQPLGGDGSVSGEDKCLDEKEKFVVVVLLNMVSTRA